MKMEEVTNPRSWIWWVLGDALSADLHFVLCVWHDCMSHVPWTLMALKTMSLILQPKRVSIQKVKQRVSGKHHTPCDVWRIWFPGYKRCEFFCKQLDKMCLSVDGFRVCSKPNSCFTNWSWNTPLMSKKETRPRCTFTNRIRHKLEGNGFEVF